MNKKSKFSKFIYGICWFLLVVLLVGLSSYIAKLLGMDDGEKCKIPLAFFCKPIVSGGIIFFILALMVVYVINLLHEFKIIDLSGFEEEYTEEDNKNKKIKIKKDTFSLKDTILRIFIFVILVLVFTIILIKLEL